MKKYIRKNEYYIQCIVFAILWLGGCISLGFYIGGDGDLEINLNSHTISTTSGSLWGMLFLVPGIMPLGLPILTIVVFPKWNLKRRQRKGLDLDIEDHIMGFDDVMKETSKRIKNQTLEL